MAQALEKMNVFKIEKNEFFAQKMVIIFQNSFLQNPVFSKVQDP